MDFQWNAGNLSEIGKHGLYPADVEDVVRNPEARVRPTYRREGEDRAAVIGPTGQGRILVVVVTPRGAVLRVVTAYPADPRTERRYREGRI